MTDSEEDEEIFEVTKAPKFINQDGKIGLSIDFESSLTGETKTEFILIAELDNTDSFDTETGESVDFTVSYTRPEVYTFRNYLLSLSSDDERLEAIKELGFCLSCGEDMEGRERARRKLMTWNEFKQVVDDRLAKEETDGNIDIWYVDISSDGSVNITIDVRGGLKVAN